MSKTITISLETLHILYSRFLNKCILPYLPQNIQNDINILINYKSPVDVYRHLTNLIDNQDQNNQTKKQNKFNQFYSKSPQKTSINGSNQYIKKYSAGKSEKQDQKYRYQSQQKSQKNSPNKKGLKILNSSLNFQDIIIQKQQKNSNGQLKPINRSHNLINLKSPSTNSKNDLQIQKLNQILAKKSNHDSSSSSLNINPNFHYKMKRQSDSQTKNNDNDTKFKQTNKQTNKQTKVYSIQKPHKLLPPPLIPKFQSSNLSTTQIIKPYHIYSPKIQTFGHTSQNLNNYNNNNNLATKNNLKFIIKNIQQVFRQNQKKIQRYDKVSSNSSFANNLTTATYNNTQYTNTGSNKKY